jgi:hypothetical protein
LILNHYFVKINIFLFSWTCYFFHPKTKHEKSEKGKKHMEQVQFDLRTPRLRRNTFATMLLAFLLPESYVYVL